MATFEDFLKLDIRAGTVLTAEKLEGAKKPAYKLTVDFGDEIGVKKTSAQITELYREEELINEQVVAVVNFPQKQIGKFISEVLVLGVYSESGVVLIKPDKKVNNGEKLG